ncbi:MAG TPA: N-acetylmuramoyl-L-alanine amidase [Pyrinomonadaceae bacterium]|jgi:N-acetylmuramoyl-L-alanine amidase
MKIAIDPGHGMSNSKAGVFDPGAVKKVGNETFAEADITLRYGLTLKKLFQDQGIEVFMTRSSSAEAAPVGGRAKRAANAGCTHFVSLHLNSSTSSQANGVEVEFREDQKDKPLAEKLLKKMLTITHLNNHGNDKRLDLAVLKFKPGPAVLIELGFITNDKDRQFLIDGNNRDAICKGIQAALSS